ncbi:heme-binding protein [Chloroflexota bacterium]
MLEYKTIGIEEARKAAEAALKANPPGENPIAVAVVNRAGELLYYVRMDGMGAIGSRMAINKAYSAAITGMTTEARMESLQKRGRDPSWYGGDLRHETVIPGGAPIKMSDGTVVGGIGVGGKKGPDPKDTLKDYDLARIGAEALGL